MTSSPQVEGELLFLTDSAYLSLIDEQTTRPSNGKQKHDGLFLERLDSFIEGQMRDIEAFADREQHSLDEIRKLVAVPHAKFLFSSQAYAANDTPSGPSVRSTLARVSNTLQTLHSTAGLDSLLLVVAPTPPAAPSTHSPTTTEASWIGGTELGKDFWMGLKSGGLAGVHAFRAKCRAAEVAEVTLSSTGSRTRSGDIKTELNAAVRHALRTASGNPSAEMRWTRPAALEDLYGVRVRGWPAGIVNRNPSNNTVRENRHLLDCIRNGSMSFVTRGSVGWDAAGSVPEVGDNSGKGDPQTSVPPSLPGSLELNTTPESTCPPDVPAPSHADTAPYLGAAKRTAAPDDVQDRRTRRRTNADTG